MHGYGLHFLLELIAGRLQLGDLLSDLLQPFSALPEVLGDLLAAFGGGGKGGIVGEGQFAGLLVQLVATVIDMGLLTRWCYGEGTYWYKCIRRYLFLPQPHPAGVGQKGFELLIFLQGILVHGVRHDFFIATVSGRDETKAKREEEPLELRRP